MPKFSQLNPVTAVASLAAAVLFSMSTTAMAQTATWRPDRPVSLIVPYAPGGGTDATARALAKQLGVVWKQPVVVENLPGADGLIGSRRVMDAKPDGYTLLLQVPAIVLTKYIPALKGIDPLAQLAPVTSVAQSPSAIVVSAKLPVKTLPELFQYCQKSPQPCSVATGETLAKVLSKQITTEVPLPNLITVNYRGTGALTPDLISNTVNFSFTGLAGTLPHQKAGTLRVLATMGPKRAAALPDVPTTAEVGYPQLKALTWFGLFAPKGTPASVQQAIASAVREAIQDPDVRQAIAITGAEPVGNVPAAFAAQVRGEDDHLGALIRRNPLTD